MHSPKRSSRALQRREKLHLSMKLGNTTLGNPFHISPANRARHIYVIGQTGTGKSSLLQSIAHRDISSGDGMLLIDPHGDLAQATLSLIPQSRCDDLIYISPSDTERPIALNPLADISPSRAPFVAEAIVSAFHTVWPDAWGPRMEYIFINALRVLMDMPETSLLALPKLLADKKFRKRAVSYSRDPAVSFFWNVEFDSYQEKFANEAVAPVQNKIGRVIGIPALRNILSQPKNTVDFREAMDTKKIVIVNLAKGKLGEGPAYLFGALIVSLLANAALSRADASERPIFHLIADEFQNFATDSFALILSEARKYALTLTLAHQHLGQLPESVRHAVLGNAGTMLSLRIGGEDADLIAKHMDVANPTQLQDLPNFIALARTLTDAGPSEPTRIALTPPIFPTDTHTTPLIARSLRRYGRERSQVEERIARFLRP